MLADQESYRRSRRSYELGRLRSAAFRALLTTAMVVAVARLALGASALPWCVLTFAAVLVTEWKGEGFLHGARRGVLVGLSALLVPVSLLRPCCTPERMRAALQAGVSCCTEPSSCILFGALLGVLASFALPASGRRAPVTTVAGFALGAVSVAAVRCAPLFVGESVGLLSGLALALVISSLVRVRFAFAR